MNGNEAAQIMRALDRIEGKVDDNHHLLVGNGDPNAVLPRLQTLELFVRGAKLLTPILTALITAGLMYAIFGPG